MIPKENDELWNSLITFVVKRSSLTPLELPCNYSKTNDTRSYKSFKKQLKEKIGPNHYLQNGVESPAALKLRKEGKSSKIIEKADKEYWERIFTRDQSLCLSQRPFFPLKR